MKRLFTRKPKTTAPAQAKLAVRKIKAPGFKTTMSLLVAAATALFALSGYYWYNNVLTDPDRLMSRVLDQSLQTTSVARTVEQESAQSKVKQDIYLSFTPETVSQSLTKLDEGRANGTTSVTTETIGTAESDFVRYTDISVPNNNGQSFSNVLNVWGIRKGDPQSGQQASFLNDALFVVVPFGNLNSEQRNALKQKIRELNLYERRSAQLEYVNGRPLMSYGFNIDPQKLVTVLAEYVKLTGAGDGSSLNPALYEGASKIPVNMEVDVLSRRIKTIEFVGSDRKETYSAYSLVRNVQAPTQTIPVDELQSRLQTIEQQVQ
jgi:hypothetical protein